MKFKFLGMFVAFAAFGAISYAGDHDPSEEFTAGKASPAEASKCINRVVAAGCNLSKNDMSRIRENVQECKHVNSNGNTTQLEVFLLDKSDKLVVFQTKGKDKQGNTVPGSRGQCPLVKYTIDRAGMKDVLIRGNKTWMLSNSGALYIMNPDQSVVEFLKKDGTSYSGVTKIKGTDDDDELSISGSTFKDVVLSADTVKSRPRRQLKFEYHTTFESLFRDK